MEIHLDGARALVTGANSGIGRAIALALGASGARVGVNYVDHPDAADEVVFQLTHGGGEAVAFYADVAVRSDVERMFEELERRWGGLEILVNNAGIDGPRAVAWNASEEEWVRVVATNLLGAYHCSREALRRMVPRRRGVILTVTSVHEVIPWSGYSAYTASKAGASMLARTLAQEAAPYGIRVLALAPGAIQTSINEDVWSDPQRLADLLAKIPLGRLGQPEEVARLAVVLVSDVASYVTGTTVFVDGGMTLYPSFMHGG